MGRRPCTPSGALCPSHLHSSAPQPFPLKQELHGLAPLEVLLAHARLPLLLLQPPALGGVLVPLLLPLEKAAALRRSVGDDSRKRTAQDVERGAVSACIGRRRGANGDRRAWGGS